MSAMGQTGQTFPGEFKLLSSGMSCAVYHADGICSWNQPTSLHNWTFKPDTTNRISFQAIDNKSVIIMRPEKNGEYEFQIDKSKIYKGIIWTSDSTFILKRIIKR